MLKAYSAVLLAINLLAGAISYADWRSTYYLDHPLVGKIYSLTEESFVNHDNVSKALATTQYLLLGEKHTNVDHHIGQARLIQQWLLHHEDAALVLEMLEADKWPHNGQVWQDVQQLNEELKLLASRWDWQIYQPIIDVAITKKLPIFAANLSREALARYAKGSVCQLEHAEKSMQICDTINKAKYTVINQLIYDAHCGYVPTEQLEPLVDIQIAKDAAFALSLVSAGEHSNAVLITGAVHARKDIGVPVHLKKLGVASLSIVFLPVDPMKENPQAYLDEHSGRQYDYLFFTPSERNTDPCVEFAEQLKKMNKH